MEDCTRRLQQTAQSPYFGKKVPFDPKTILMIAFSATAKEYPIDIDLKNIHLVK